MKIWNDTHETFQLDKDGYYVLNPGHNEICDSHWEYAINHRPHVKQAIIDLDLLPYDDYNLVTEWFEYKSTMKQLKESLPYDREQYSDLGAYIRSQFEKNDIDFMINIQSVINEITESIEKAESFIEKHKDNQICLSDSQNTLNEAREVLEIVKECKKIIPEQIKLTKDTYNEFLLQHNL